MPFPHRVSSQNLVDHAKDSELKQLRAELNAVLMTMRTTREELRLEKDRYSKTNAIPCLELATGPMEDCTISTPYPTAHNILCQVGR